jgi:hypothetical protein
VEKNLLISARDAWAVSNKIAYNKVEAIGSPKRGDK